MPFERHISGTRFGRYKIISKIGLGGMAEVFRAETTSEKPIAIKKILPSFTDSDKFIKMFLDEAKIMVTLRHPNIVELVDFGKIEDVYYLAMEWVDGKALGNLVRRQIERRMIFPPGLAVFIALEIACGLDYAHKKKDSFNRTIGIVHRDISPPNILLSWNGEVKITDFGIAKAAGKASLTKPGILKGKFSYMSPEQARGEEIDHRSDVFSLATVLYEMLTGTRLFLRDREHKTIDAVKRAKILKPSIFNPRIPDNLERVVMKGLSRNVKKRYHSAEEFGDALEEVLVKSYPQETRKSLSSFMQFLYPEKDIMPDMNKKIESIDFWSDQASKDSEVIASIDSRFEEFNQGFLIKPQTVIGIVVAFSVLLGLLIYKFFPESFDKIVSFIIKFLKA